MKHFALPLLLLTLLITNTHAQNEKVRAIFVLQLAKYSSWTIDDATKSFVMTVVGADKVADELRSVTKGKTVCGLPIDVYTVKSARNLPKSDIIYLDQKFADKTRTVINEQYGNKTLIIGGQEGMCLNGAQISLTDYGNKVGFEWSRYNIKRGGVKISDKVLNMGRELN